MFRRILIANRGEVVVRILQTTKRLGIEAVVVVSEADRDAPYVADADAVVCLGPAPSAQSYLDRHGVIQAALQTGASAVHPGWGFLAEDALFADMCRQHGLAFVGPPSHVMRLMGRKLEAKRAARRAGLDVIPGSDGLLANFEDARVAAEQVGYPLILKADAGGGGRGMRLCEGPDDLEEGFNLAQAEAQACFAEPGLYLESFLTGERHIEVQILADAYGHAIHLGERDCSVQRKHQKLLEESPSPVLTPEAARAAGESAARAAESFGYVGAGTIEFLQGEDGTLRFMEMNTRLQVEHSVTEVRCGLDLVEQQLRIACNEPLTLSQEDVKLEGHAIEIRINAEDPTQDFRPCPGKIERFSVPDTVRVDTHVCDGYVVPPHYDSLIAKLIAHAPDRTACIAKLQAALADSTIDGIATTKPVFEAILASQAFAEGEYHTRLIPGWPPEGN